MHDKEMRNPLRIATKVVEQFIVDRIENHIKDDDGNIFCLVHWQGVPLVRTHSNL